MNLYIVPMKGEPALGPEAPRFKVEYDHILQVKVPPLEWPKLQDIIYIQLILIQIIFF